MPAKVFKLSVNPADSSSNGALKMAEMGLLMFVKLSISDSPFEALENSILVILDRISCIV